MTPRTTEPAAPLVRALGEVPGTSRGLSPADLLLDLAAVLHLLPETIRRREWLDSFLLAAAADQILEDSLAGSAEPGGRAWWRRVAAELERHDASRVGGVGVRACVGGADRLLELSPRARRILSLHAQLSSLAGILADAVMDGAVSPDVESLALWAQVALTDGEQLPAGIRRHSLRLPSSFRSFDQRPADVDEMVDRFTSLCPDWRTPVLVVGVRTSGSYLGPLAAAALRRRGYRDVQCSTIRPGTTAGERERALVKRAAREGHPVVVLDDPPASGRSVHRVAQSLEYAGVRSEQITLMLALQGEAAELPPSLRSYPAVVLPWSEWHVHKLLEPAHVAAELTAMLGTSGLQVRGVRRCDSSSGSGRTHVRAFFVAEVADARGGPSRTLEVAVEGAGIGFFGRHVLTVAKALGPTVPPVYGFSDGLVYRAWVHGPTARQTMTESSVYRQIAAYAARRHEMLGVARDRSLSLAGNQPVWEVASSILASPLGRVATPLRPFLVDPLVRRMLSVSRPSIIDGRMEPEYWHRDDRAELVKVHFADGAFSNLDLSSYDSVFDLAGAAAELSAEGGGAGAAQVLRRRYEEYTGTRVDHERWLAYQLVHLWDSERRGRRSRMATETESARATQRYFADVYLADLPRVLRGPLCAVDLDGVFESSTLGFSSTTAAGALGLRALRAHGFRVVIATGRSLGEVVDRCQNFDLAGGVAEYGSAIFDNSRSDAVELLSIDGQRAVEAARDALSRRAGLEVDPRFRYAVRVRAQGRRRRSVAPYLLGSLPSPPGGPWQVIVGEDQTDLVLPGMDKGHALKALAQHLDGRSADGGLALAVGDSLADVSMLLMAKKAFRPANSDEALGGAGIPLLRHSYQRGFAEAVERLIGHPPGGCPACRPPEQSSNRRLLLDILSVQEDGPKGMARGAGRLALHFLDTEAAR